MKNYLRGGAALSAMLVIGGLSSVAQADDETSATQQLDDSSGGQAEASSSAADSDRIVVTARRRNEFLQDVPIAVSAITGEQARRIGVDGTDALAMTTPTLDYSRQGGFAFIPFLRGVGTSGAGAGFESPVAIYVDDVYYASPNAKLFELENVESVQVLKGPQGTLFGRNATGGVIQITTLQPDSEPAGRLSFGYGSYDTIEGSFYANAGLSDNIAANIAASGSKQSEGFGQSITTGVETQKSWDWNIRGQMLFDLGEATSVKLSADYSDYKGDIGWNLGVLPGAVGIGGTMFSGEFNTATLGVDFTRIRQSGASLHINHQMPFADLVSISAYRDTRMETSLDQDASPIPFFTLDLDSPTQTFSQELRLVSNSDSRLQWVVGAYYLDMTAGYDPATLTGIFFDPGAVGDPAGTFAFKDEQTLDSYSAFAEGTYELADNTNLTLGLRYTEDQYGFDVFEQTLASSTIPEFNIPGGAFSMDDTFAKLTYRAILDHRFTPDILGYVSYNRGFKSGGYNVAEPGFANTQAPVSPEVLDALEVGLKTTPFDNLTFNAAAFYYDYQDLAVSITRQTSLFIVNAAAAEIKGVDADFVFTPLDGLRIAGGVGYLDSEYTEFPNGPVYTPDPVNGGNTVGGADLSGNRTQRTPEWTVNVAPSYSFRAGEGDVVLAASYYYNSGFFPDPENRLEQPSYSLINASAGYELDNGLGIRVWGKNLTDERYYLFLQADVFKDPASYAAPETYGVTLWKEF